MVRTWTLSTVHQRPLYFPNKTLSADTIRRKGYLGLPREGYLVLVAMVVIVESEEMMLIVVMILKVVFGALTKSPIHPDLVIL
jgi:hypothetical protein